MILRWPSDDADDLGRIVVAVFLVLTLLAGGWLTGQWMLGNIAQDNVHPGYFLPTVAGELVGGLCGTGGAAGNRRSVLLDWHSLLDSPWLDHS